MSWPQRRHFIRSVRPETFSSAIWYFALQLPHRNFIAFLALGASAGETPR
jgi:hypothetical protein